MIAKGKNQFVLACRTAAAAFGLPLVFGYHDGPASEFLLNGYLYVNRYGKRARFDISTRRQDVAEIQNEATRNVLRALDIPVQQKVLAPETHDELRIRTDV